MIANIFKYFIPLFKIILATLLLAVTLSGKDNQKLSKPLSKRSERSVYWNEYNAKSDSKNMTNEYIFFLKSNFLGVTKLFMLIYLNIDDYTKRL